MGESSKVDRNALYLVIPRDFSKDVLQGCHKDVRHLGLECMLDLLKDQLKVTKDKEQHAANCNKSLQFKPKA